MSRRSKEGLYYDQAQRLYVVDGLPVTAIAERLTVSRNTLQRWKQKGDWDAARKARMRSPVAPLELAERTLQAKLEDLSRTNPADVDATMLDGLHKLVTTIGKLKKEHDRFQITVLVFMDLVPWVKRTQPASVQQLFFDAFDAYLSDVKEAA